MLTSAAAFRTLSANLSRAVNRQIVGAGAIPPPLGGLIFNRFLVLITNHFGRQQCPPSALHALFLFKTQNSANQTMLTLCRKFTEKYLKFNCQRAVSSTSNESGSGGGGVKWSPTTKLFARPGCFFRHDDGKACGPCRFKPTTPTMVIQ